MSLKEQVTIDDVAETVPPKEQTAVEQKNEDIVTNDEFGFKAEFTPDEYTTVSGKDYRDVDGATQYNITDFAIGDVVQGYPEVTLFDNMEKDENGEFKRKSQSVRIRIIDIGDEYVDLYANIPRRDSKGFIKDLNKGFKFMRTGFDLCFSFMRWIDETNVVTPSGEAINKINIINIENICHKIDTMDFIKVKIIKGAEKEYPSWIILDMQKQ